jgi:hypothetical protein
MAASLHLNKTNTFISRNAKNILLPAIAGTSLMTVFSYIITELEDKNFSEPELLAHIEKRLLKAPKKIALLAGWATHYSVGIMITSFFYLIRQNTNMKSAFKGSLILGALSGLSAIVAWKIALKTLPGRSDNFYNKFYSQLFVAHFVFAATVILTEKAIKRR